MSSVKVLHNNRCTKSRNALSLLDEHQISYETIPYLDGVLAEKDIRDLLAKLQLNAEDIVRKTEAIYKEKFKGKTMTNDQWIKALAENPKLIERPIVYNEKTAVVGRPTENVLTFIQKLK